MTIARALFIKLMQQYARHAYRLTLLEIQKLAYFLQESGLDLRLRYVKHLYGPYAHNLNGLELLASVHWLSVHDGEAVDCDSAVSAMGAWNDRKRRLFKPDHIRVAWDRLQAEGWVPASRGTER
jgi:hypothetical protein